MKKYQFVKDGGINLAELSRWNGKSEFENAKMIINVLAMKAEITKIPQRVILKRVI